ncbi:LysR family transcriptional regulator [Pseudorhodoferax soli]|uniref:DNA-binding transcriptional LysR family regulator n=1 Tax=Pseudorhodoferax soli TaxID=545864 RepID=A0A368XZJ3_9BURK|nr:LysR substrate-binding domain-containing protein [Pseudorhodoferax soli]RCW72859.1 DNA-binding transcriptional LysR family regulator [Pseudorhodoferax soli]
MSASPPTTGPVLHERLLARLRLRHLKLIDALAAQAHLRRAAEAVHISQPAATQLLRELEDLLGLALFERHARGMRITEAGRVLARHARVAIEALASTAEALAQHAAGQQRPLRVGAILAALSLVRPALPALRAQHPMLRLAIEEASIERLLAGLQGGALDLVLLRQPATVPEGCRFEALRPDRMVVLAGAGHPWTGRKRLRLRDLSGARWVLPPPHFAVRQALDAAFAREAAPPLVHAIQVLVPELLPTVLAEAGVLAPVPQSALDRLDGALVQVLPLDLQAPLEPLGMLYRRSDAEGPLAPLVAFLSTQAAA